MPHYPPEQLPAHDRLADSDDELDWDRLRHGPMAAYANDGDTIPVDVHGGPPCRT